MNGGGIYCVGGSANPTVSNNVFVNNSASDKGGAIYCADNNHPQFINNTIANNSAGYGGGIYCGYSCTPAFKNCILYGNVSGDGSQVFLDDEPSDPSFIYCDIEGGSAAFGLNGNFYTGTYASNISADPLFLLPSAGAGAAYNGLTAKWIVNPSSSCINIGDPAGPYPATDIAGNPRIYGGRIDVGAYELQATGIRKTDLTYSISVYPNPFHDQTKIHFKEQVKNAELRVLNLQGQLVRTYHFSNDDSFIFSREGLPVGTYFLQAYSGDQLKAVEKLVVKD